MKKDLKLPDLPDGMEWVIHADHDRFTVNLSYSRPLASASDETDKPTEGRVNGYVMSHTHRHPTVIPQAEWESEVVSAASYLWTCYTEGNHHAAWADSLMRRSR